MRSRWMIRLCAGVAETRSHPQPVNFASCYRRQTIWTAIVRLTLKIDSCVGVKVIAGVRSRALPKIKESSQERYPELRSQPSAFCAETSSMAFESAFLSASRYRGIILRRCVLSLLQACSIGLKSGEYAGKYFTRVPPLSLSTLEFERSCGRSDCRAPRCGLVSELTPRTCPPTLGTSAV